MRTLHSVLVNAQMTAEIAEDSKALVAHGTGVWTETRVQHDVRLQIRSCRIPLTAKEIIILFIYTYMAICIVVIII